MDGRLAGAAQGLADDLAAHRLLSHVSSDGSTLQERVGRTGYIASRTGWRLAENIAWATRGLSSPLAVAQGWMDSTEHRLNVLDPSLSEVGIGIAAGAPSGISDSGIYYVADFGTPGRSLASRAASKRARTCHRRKRSRRHRTRC
jgi:uncharacterized protein YkwD